MLHALSDQTQEFEIDRGQPKGFLRPCLLLLLQEAPAHGYELLERLREFEFERDPGGLYRNLRALEHEGLVRSEWEPSLHGPDRRRYEVTPRGSRYLDAWAATVAETMETLQSYLARYQRAFAVAGSREDV